MERSKFKFIFHRRLSAINLFITIFIVIIGIRFFYLQIFQYEFYNLKASNNSIRTIPIDPSRGLIFDRNDKVLADNRLIYNLELSRDKNYDLDKISEELDSITKISDADIKNFQKHIESDYFSDTIPIKTDLNPRELAAFSAKQYLFNNVSLKIRQKRYYKYDYITSHLLGHINHINKYDIKKLRKENKYKRYLASHYIGKTGIELTYEDTIHGFPGFKQIEINAKNKVVQTLQTVAPIDGNNINLTIDIDLQKTAYNAFENKKGALVAIDVNNGEILAYVSRPGFDPNLFIEGIDPKSWEKLNNEKSKPLLDRVINGLYPPGSTLKPFIALSGLENNLRRPPFKINDPGYFTMPNGSKTFKDWKKGGHGEVDLSKAITVSCDTFFYGLGLELGVNRMNKTLSKYYFGKKTGVDMLNEKIGLLADEEWKKNKFNKPWYGGETAITAIGQGFTQVTPIQLAYATALIANPELNKKPHLLLYSEKKELFKNIQETPKVNSKDLKLVNDAMIGVTEDGGTAAFIGKNISYKIAAKTGTAQVFSLKGQEYDEENLPENLKDHALFIAYAPANQPKVALAVIVEHGGHGGSAAGPIAKKFFDHYMRNLNLDN